MTAYQLRAKNEESEFIGVPTPRFALGASERRFALLIRAGTVHDGANKMTFYCAFITYSMARQKDFSSLSHRVLPCSVHQRSRFVMAFNRREHQTLN